VLLAKSTSPPAGLANTPTTPLPSPLKNPAAPASLAPAERQVERNMDKAMWDGTGKTKRKIHLTLIDR